MIANQTERAISTANGFRMIQNLEIKNFRCFKSLKLSGLSRFNIVVGDNGSGKSTLLEALFVAGGISPEIYLRARAWRGVDEIAISSHREETIEGIFRDAFFGFNTDSIVEISFDDSERGHRSLEIFLGGEDEVTLPLKGKRSVPPPGKEIRFRWKSPKGSHISRIEIAEDRLKMARFSDPFPMVMNNPSTYYSSQNADRYSALSRTKQEGSILRAIQSVYPYIEDLSIEIEATKSTIFASVKGLEERLPVGFVSAGISKYLGILLAAASTKKGLVLVDEIENGWFYQSHSDVWSNIVKFCRENEVQLFVTTHSKEWLSLIEPDIDKYPDDYCVLRAERVDGHSTVRQFSGKDLQSAVRQQTEIR